MVDALVVGEVVGEGGDGDVSLEEFVDIGIDVCGVEGEAMGGGPVVGGSLWGGAFFVLVYQGVGVHWADDCFGLVGEVLGCGDVDGEDFVCVWEAVFEEGVDGFSGGLGGFVPVWIG